MTRFAPSWALSAAALDADGDPHLKPGVHLRVLPSLHLGLPVAPLLVERIQVDNWRRLPTAHDVVWTDADGDALSLPFDLGAASPATAWLPDDPGNPVIYAEVLVKPESPWEDFDRWRRRPRPAPPPRSRGLRDELVGPLHRGPGWDRIRWPLPRSGVRAEAVVSGPLGPSVLATATRAPYQLCATGMDRVLVTGAGTVTGIRLLRARDTKARPGREPWRLLALPVDSGARYQGIQDAYAEATLRVERGAPVRLGLHDEPDAPDPASCSTATDVDELFRVETLWSKRVEELVRTVVDDLSAPPRDLMVDPGPLIGPKVTDATIALPALSGVLQAGIDPGMGRMLGLVEHDESPGSEGSLVVYVIRGAWVRYPRKRWFLGSLLGGPDAVDDFPLDLPEIVKEQQEGGFLDLWTLAAVVVGAPAVEVPPPAVGTVADLGWVPEAPPSSRRHVVLPLSGLGPAAVNALARETPGVIGLNPRLPQLLGGGPDRAVPIMPAILEETGPTPAGQRPGEGEVHDRMAPEDACDYRVAQADWFGRWSRWSHGSAPAGARPPVPVPMLELSYVDPASPGSPGRLEVRCPQPRPEDLAAGGLPLERLDVRAEVGGGPVSTSVGAIATAPGDEPPLLQVSVTVPALGVSEKRRLTATARWVDTASRSSAESPPAVAHAVDPRAPAPLSLPNTLQYAARPDALGRARVDIEWPATAGTAYRVYASDETTLQQRLAALVASGAAGAATASAALAAATTAPDRAAVFRTHAGLFDRTCFELVTASPLLATSSGTMRHRYETSASLDVLVFLKVLPVAVLAASPSLELGAETPFSTSTLVIRGIPNGEPPPTPTLTARPDPADPLAVRLTVDVPAGQTAPVTLRLRRSRVSGGDAQTMPVVLVTTPTSWPVTVVDRGGTPWDTGMTFAPWSTYTWRAEVQGGPEPGSTVPGLWSRASAPASWKVVPGSPVGVTPGAATAEAAGVSVTFTSPDPLDAGPEGSYLLDVYRRSADPAVVPSGPVGSFPAAALRQADGSYTVRDTSLGVPVGSSYLVEVCDPLGRRSPRVVVGTLA